MDMVNMVEDYNTAKDLANTSSKSMGETTGLADMRTYTDYDPVYSAEGTKDIVIERVGYKGRVYKDEKKQDS